MNKHEISDDIFLKQVKQWIESDGAIYVDIYVFHAPGYFLISSYRDFEELISIMDGRGEVTVVRHPDCLLGGFADIDLLNKAIDILTEGKEWKLLCTDSKFGGRGSTHQELKDIFARIKNKYVVINNIDDHFPPNRPPRNNEKILEAEFR